MIRCNQLIWFRHISKNLHDILDAHSVHIYWDYDDVPKITRRLDGVLRVVGHFSTQARVYHGVGTRGKGINKNRGSIRATSKTSNWAFDTDLETTIVPFSTRVCS